MYSLLFLIPLVLIVFWWITVHNSIITQKNAIAQSFGSIEIYLKKRFDLIPNLIALLKKYSEHEKGTLEKITELREAMKEMQAKNQQNESPEQMIATSNEITHILKGLNIQVEDYPELKADTQFLSVQEELADIEEYISAARRSYNAGVTQYNTYIQVFPTNIISSLRRDKSKSLLKITQEEQKNVDIGKLF